MENALLYLFAAGYYVMALGVPLAMVTARRLRQATWGSWAFLAGMVLALSTGPVPGLYGFLTLAAIALAAPGTLGRGRQQVIR